MYPDGHIEKAQEATLAMRVAILRADLILAEEELSQFEIKKLGRNRE